MATDCRPLIRVRLATEIALPFRDPAAVNR
jgi:hypothetical protein